MTLFATLTVTRATLADLAARTRASREARAARQGQGRAPGRAARFYADAAAHLDQQEAGALLPLKGAVEAWILQREQDGETFGAADKSAGILATTHTLAKAGRLPHGLTKTTAEDGLSYLTLA